MPSIRNPVSFSATPLRYDLPPPRLDEHGEELRSWLAGPRDAGPHDDGGER